MAQYLPFWTKAGIAGYATGAGEANGALVYSKALPTNGCTEVVVQFEADVKPGPAGAIIKFIPQISNDGVNWEDNTDAVLDSVIQASSSVPFQDTKKFTTIAAFMRMKINCYAGAAALVGGSILISGAGRT